MLTLLQRRRRLQPTPCIRDLDLTFVKYSEMIFLGQVLPFLMWVTFSGAGFIIFNNWVKPTAKPNIPSKTCLSHWYTRYQPINQSQNEELELSALYSQFKLRALLNTMRNNKSRMQKAETIDRRINFANFSHVKKMNIGSMLQIHSKNIFFDIDLKFLGIVQKCSLIIKRNT